MVDNVGDKLLVMTNKNAPRYRLVLIDPKKPQEQNWKTVIPESQNVLEGVSTVGGKLIATYMKDAASQVVVYDMNGKQLTTVELPTLGTVSGFNGDKDDKEVFFTFHVLHLPANHLPL